MKWPWEKDRPDSIPNLKHVEGTTKIDLLKIFKIGKNFIKKFKEKKGQSLLDKLKNL